MNTLKKAALDHHIEKIKGYNKNDKTTYPSDPKKRGHLLEADILERDLQLEKEKGRKFTTGKEERDHFKYFTKYGEMLTPTKEEIEKSKGPSWDTIYASFDINEKVDGTPLKENEVLMVRLPNLYLKKIKNQTPNLILSILMQNF